MTSQIKISFLFFLLLNGSVVGFSQNAINNKVRLIEKQNGKRLELFAKNTDTVSYNVFLRVTTNDYRRTAKRPVLKTVAANSESHLITLIKLVGSEGVYKPHFIVNKTPTNIAFRKDYNGLQTNFINALKRKNITIYESESCSFCATTKTSLNANKITFKALPILGNEFVLIRKLKQQGLPSENLKENALILQIESDLYMDISNKKEFLEVLKKHIK